MSEQIHMVKRKRDVGVILFLAWFILYYTYSVYRIVRNDRYLDPDILLICCYLTVIGMFSYKLFCLLRYSFNYYPHRITELELLPGSFRLGSCSLKASEINTIRIDGYWNPTIGVKVKGKKQIPLHLRMKFQTAAQEDEIKKELLTWSEIHQIPIEYKRIIY